MSANDPILGKSIQDFFSVHGIETPMASGTRPGPDSVRNKIQSCCTGVMNALGLDMTDDSLSETPHRIAKMYCDEIFTGLDYANFPKCTTIQNKMSYDEMILVKGITVQSMCEHHFLPFVGKAHIAYIPKSKVMGLSKFNRIVDFFARRPQVQERLTEQVAAALEFILETNDVAVVIEADHFCVKLRGVRDIDSTTTTSKMTGRFRDVAELRTEFLSLVK